MQRNKKAELGWVMFDWANSSYSLVISTAIFPIFFLDNSNAIFNIGSIEISNASLYAFTVSFSYIIVCLSVPLLSGIADYGGHRKKFMRFFATLGSLACMILFFFDGPETQWLALTAFMLATSSHAGSLVFYDSYLSELVPHDEADKLSAKGYAFGYFGSVLLMCLNIAMIKNPEFFGIPNAQLAARFSFLSVGIWWLGFAQFSFAWLPKDPTGLAKQNWFRKGIGELRKAWAYSKSNSNIRLFLMAFFFYSAGVQTVVYLASSFAKQELKFDTSELITIILLLQLVAIVGAYLFAFVSRKTNNLFALKIMIGLWMMICLFAYRVYEHSEFYVLAAMVGMVLGGIQAISRSSYSKIIPKSHPDITCLYSFYDIIYYVSIVFGTFTFGFLNHLTNSMRLSVLALMIFFLIALVLIWPLKKIALEQKYY